MKCISRIAERQRQQQERLRQAAELQERQKEYSRKQEAERQVWKLEALRLQGARRATNLRDQNLREQEQLHFAERQEYLLILRLRCLNFSQVQLLRCWCCILYILMLLGSFQGIQTRAYSRVQTYLKQP